MPQKEKSTFSHFFKEDAEVVQDIIQGNNGQQLVDKVGTANKDILPKISKPKDVSDDEFSAFWKSLRSFFRNDKNDKPLPKGLTPVIMSPLYTRKMVGSSFPVWVADDNFGGNGEYCISLKDLITRGLEQIAPEEKDAHIIKENIERIIHIANEQLSDKLPEFFTEASGAIFDELEKQLEVTGDEVESFNRDLTNLKKSLPQNGVLLPYSNNTSLQILQAAMFATHDQARQSLEDEIHILSSKLNDLLRIEQDKGPGKKVNSLDFVDSMVNFDELSAIMPESGTERMDETRVKRISEVVKDLKDSTEILYQQGFMFVEEELFNNKAIDWVNLFDDAEVNGFKAGSGCKNLTNYFNKHISAWTKLFIAKRIGDLELENIYQPDVHDEFFAHFSWQSLTKEELNNCPYFVLVADDTKLFNTEFSALANMLTQNIPAKIVAIKSDSFSEGNQNSNLHSQTELSGLMLSHKNIYVAQSTSITPKYLFNAFTQGLSAFSPAFFSLLNVDERIHDNPYLWTSATVESRDFPGFTFNGLLGTPWGSRFKVDNNPQPELTFTSHELSVINTEGNKIEMSFPFTFADQAILNPAYHYHFMHVEAAFWSENLIPLTEYIASDIEANISKVPFIWAMDANNELQKVAVSWQVVVTTQERLDFWRFLQENSGINNFHVAQAVESTKEEMQTLHEQEIEKLKLAQQQEIDEVRNEEAGKVMDNLTSVLLGLDTSQVIPAATPVTREDVVDDGGNEAAEEKAEEAPATEDSVLSNDPYIDTPLCTSCNECINKNGKLFNYNADKMAFIADAKAGTFNELVESAELCPVGIIHPGSPLNPDEPDLESLIERAAKFN